MAVLEECGRFWWSENPVPAGHFVPEESITGLLTIDDDGRIAVDLDDYFSGKHRPFGLLERDGIPLTRNIPGTSRTTNKRVLLVALCPAAAKYEAPAFRMKRYIATDGLKVYFCIFPGIVARKAQTLLF